MQSKNETPETPKKLVKKKQPKSDQPKKKKMKIEPSRNSFTTTLTAIHVEPLNIEADSIEGVIADPLGEEVAGTIDPIETVGPIRSIGCNITILSFLSCLILCIFLSNILYSSC